MLIQGCLVTEQNVNTVLELIQDQLKGLEDFLAKTTSTLHGYDGSEEVKFVQKKKKKYLCDFAKQCPLSFCFVQASVAGKKLGGLPSCWVSAESPGPDLSMGGWLTCFVSKSGE